MSDEEQEHEQDGREGLKDDGICRNTIAIQASDRRRQAFIHSSHQKPACECVSINYCRNEYGQHDTYCHYDPHALSHHCSDSSYHSIEDIGGVLPLYNQDPEGDDEITNNHNEHAPHQVLLNHATYLLLILPIPTATPQFTGHVEGNIHTQITQRDNTKETKISGS